MSDDQATMAMRVSSPPASPVLRSAFVPGRRRPPSPPPRPFPPRCPAVDWNPQVLDVGSTRYYADQRGGVGVICGYDRDERPCPPNLRECADRPRPVNVGGSPGGRDMMLATDPVCMNFDGFRWNFSRAAIDPVSQTARCPNVVFF